MATTRVLAGIPGGLLATFACRPGDAEWDRVVQQCHNHVIAFPRSPVWITFEGREPLLADSTQVMLHRIGQRYQRSRAAGHGDYCHFIALTDELIREIAADIDPAAADAPTFTFGHPHTRVTPAMYLAFRTALAAGIADGDATRIAEACFRAGRAVTRTAAGTDRRAPAVNRSRRDVVEAAKSAIGDAVVGGPTDGWSLVDVAARLHVSPYHLTRSFTLVTGGPMHRYLTDVRLRAGLDILLDAPDRTVATVAHDLGFANHAHFTTSFRSLFGVTPTEARRAGAGTRRDIRATIRARI